MAERLIRDFRTTIDLLSRGKYVEKLDSKLVEMLDALASMPDEAGKATMTLQITLTRLGDRVSIQPKVSIKLPEEKGFGDTTLFAAEHGLSLQHPSQMDMFAGPRDARERNTV